jgi:hypothetical protein
MYDPMIDRRLLNSARRSSGVAPGRGTASEAAVASQRAHALRPVAAPCSTTTSTPRRPVSRFTSSAMSCV